MAVTNVTHPDPHKLEWWCELVPSSEEERSHYRYILSEGDPPPFEGWVMGFRALRREYPWYTETEHMLVCERCGFVQIFDHDDYVCQDCRKELDERNS